MREKRSGFVVAMKVYCGTVCTPRNGVAVKRFRDTITRYERGRRVCFSLSKNNIRDSLEGCFVGPAALLSLSSFSALSNKHVPVMVHCKHTQRCKANHDVGLD